MPLTHIVSALSSPVRLSDYGIGIFEACMTKSALKKALKKGWIQVDGKPGTTAIWIKGGEAITLNIPDSPKPKKELIFPLKVIYEDEYLAVVHKPAGILVSGNGFMNIVNALPQNLQKSTLSDACAPQTIHRLDYATTGVLLVGKTKSAIIKLSQAFQEKQVQKTYYAITIGTIQSQGVITTEIDGKPAETHFTMMDSVPSPRFGQLNLVKLDPKTGRRHQIRKHIAGIGNPILGDKDYGKEGLILNGKGMYLHAYSLRFQHPESKKEMVMRSEFPKRFRKIFSSDHD